MIYKVAYQYLNGTDDRTTTFDTYSDVLKFNERKDIVIMDILDKDNCSFEKSINDKFYRDIYSK